MAFTRQSPSLIPDLETMSRTFLVMFRKSILAGTVKVRYSVVDFIAGEHCPELRSFRSEEEEEEEEEEEGGVVRTDYWWGGEEEKWKAV